MKRSTKYKGKPCYGWQQAPENLQTFSQLRANHLKPQDRRQADGFIWCKDAWTPLYDSQVAIPRRKMTDAQKLAHLATWKKTQEKYTCQYCGAAPAHLADLKRCVPGACTWCFEQRQHWAMLDEDHQDAIRSARELLSRSDVAVIDTETTNLDGVAIEVAVVDLAGTTLFHSLINPECPVSPGARAVHGISDLKLAEAPTLPEVWPRLVAALDGKKLLLAYNADFDEGILSYSARRYNLPELAQKWRCLMRLYAVFVGEWSDYHKSYRWQPLNGGHRALGDALAALDLLKDMARAEENEPSPAREYQEKEANTPPGA